MNQNANQSTQFCLVASYLIKIWVYLLWYKTIGPQNPKNCHGGGEGANITLLFLDPLSNKIIGLVRLGSRFVFALVAITSGKFSSLKIRHNHTFLVIQKTRKIKAKNNPVPQNPILLTPNDERRTLNTVIRGVVHSIIS